MLVMLEFKRCLWLSQSLLLGLLLVCSLMIPSVAMHNGGVSNFGNDHSTELLYILGFSSSVFFLILAGWKVLKMIPKFTGIAILLFGLSALTLLVLLSTFPRHISWSYSVLHDDLGIALYTYEFMLSVWLVIKLKSSLTIWLIIIELTGSIFGLMSILKIIHFLFIGQAIGSIGFALILVIILPEVLAVKLKHQSRLIRA